MSASAARRLTPSSALPRISIPVLGLRGTVLTLCSTNSHADGLHFRLHHQAKHKMLPTVTDVPWSVDVSVGHDREL